jgi:sarcosine oxidase subunit beta
MNAEVVVIGAGVIGASVAWHLGSLGVRGVLLLEREPLPGQGSTGKATGGFRAQYATDINVRLSLLARDKLRRFRDELGVDPGYRPAGYLWLARSQEELDDLRAAHRVQRGAGLGDARLLAPHEIAGVNPAVRAGGLLGGAFCPTDGFLRPAEILRGYLEGALRAGASLRTGVRVVGFDVGTGGRIRRARTTAGDVEAAWFINAAGPWAAEVARLAGAPIPVTPLRRQVALTEPCDRLPEGMPLTIFMEDGFHLRVRDGRVLLLWPTPGRADDRFDTSVEADWIAGVSRIAAERIPCLAGVGIDRSRSWAGLYEMSPDRHALLGAAPGRPNLLLVNGSSGHGVMHAPALGQLAAEIVARGQATALDVTPLRPSRFAEGQPNPSPERL